MKELIGFWLICLALAIFCVCAFADEMTIKEKVIFVFVAMTLLAILIVGVFLLFGGV